MKNYIVTGASGGIGYAVVKKLLSQGALVCALGRSKGKLEAKFKGFDNILFFECDFKDDSSISNVIKDIVTQVGPVSGFVHCAGFDKLSPLHLNKRKDIENLMSIHVYAAFDFCKFIAKKGNCAEDCSIVLISSLAAHEGAKGHTAYAAAKGALEGFLPSAACELADKGIRLNLVSFGAIQSDMSDGYIGKMSEEQLTNFKSSYPLGLGNTDDAANLITFLLSEKARWITGQNYIADGGHLIGAR